MRRRWARASVKVLRPEPGDVVVLEARQPITMDEAAMIRQRWEEHFPETRVAVLSGSLRLGGVVRQEEA